MQQIIIYLHSLNATYTCLNASYWILHVLNATKNFEVQKKNPDPYLMQNYPYLFKFIY